MVRETFPVRKKMLMAGLTAATLGLVAIPLGAADDPIAIRQALMDSNGASAALAGGVMKGDIAYSPVIGKAVINSLAATSDAFGSFFPEGSTDPARSSASPKIWEDAPGFAAELGKFQAASAAAAKASGRDGPADAKAFAAAVGPILDSCKSCHQDYRIKK